MGTIRKTHCVRGHDRTRPGATIKGACRECERMRRNPRTRRAETLRQYGLTRESFRALVVEQDGRCPICRVRPRADRFGRALVVDHSHSSGRVRGLLCRACNVLLGMARDDPDVLVSAGTYLLRTEQGYADPMPLADEAIARLHKAA